jgi:hypothetical protein
VRTTDSGLLFRGLLIDVVLVWFVCTVVFSFCRDGIVDLDRVVMILPQVHLRNGEKHCRKENR